MFALNLWTLSATRTTDFNSVPMAGCRKPTFDHLSSLPLTATGDADRSRPRCVTARE